MSLILKIQCNNGRDIQIKDWYFYLFSKVNFKKLYYFLNLSLQLTKLMTVKLVLIMLLPLLVQDLKCNILYFV